MSVSTLQVKILMEHYVSATGLVGPPVPRERQARFLPLTVAQIQEFFPNFPRKLP